jgi:hypothetical protein
MIPPLDSHGISRTSRATQFGMPQRAIPFQGMKCVALQLHQSLRLREESAFARDCTLEWLDCPIKLREAGATRVQGV